MSGCVNGFEEDSLHQELGFGLEPLSFQAVPNMIRFLNKVKSQAKPSFVPFCRSYSYRNVQIHGSKSSHLKCNGLLVIFPIQPIFFIGIHEHVVVESCRRLELTENHGDQCCQDNGAPNRKHVDCKVSFRGTKHRGFTLRKDDELKVTSLPNLAF